MIAIIGWALLAWVLMAVAVVTNAIFAQFALFPKIGEYKTHVYKSLVAVLIVLGVSYWIVGTLRVDQPVLAWFVGLLWFCVTVLLEFVFGHYVFGNPWSRLIADYRFWQGRLWVFVLIADLVGPPVMNALRS